MPSATRPMTPAEKYYALLDQTWPMNVLIFAELDKCFEPSYVEEVWRAFAQRRVLARTVATPELTLADAGSGAVHFTTEELSATAWDDDLHREAQVVYGFDWPLRCRYLVSPDEGRSRLLVIGHHSVLDGRIGLGEVQALVRALDGQDVPEQRELSSPAQPARYPWQDDRTARIELLRAIGSRNQELGEPGPPWWPEATGERDLHFASTSIAKDDTTRLLGTSRSHGASLFSTWAAVWLQAVANELCGGADVTLQLNAPVDLSTPSNDPVRPTAMAVAVLAQRFRTHGDTWALAGEVAAQTRLSLARGDAELFFHLARMDRADDLATGVAAVASGLRATSPAITVSNMGVIDPGSDPSWLRLIAGTLAPTPNQVIFSAVLGYRGQLVQVVSADHARLAPELARSTTDVAMTHLHGLGQQA